MMEAGYLCHLAVSVRLCRRWPVRVAHLEQCRPKCLARFTEFAVPEPRAGFKIVPPLQCGMEADILIHEAVPMMKLLQALSITTLILLIKRLVIRKPPAPPYRLPKDEWSKVRGYRRP